MLIGMRNAMFSGGWKNPYVTDGLVAMWDGEWNAGWGQHDPNATVWKDLISATSGTTAGTLSFGENYAHFDGRSCVSFQSDAIKNAVNNAISIEFVFKPLRHGSQTNNVYIAFGTEGDRGFWLWDHSQFPLSSYSWRTTNTFQTIQKGSWNNLITFSINVISSGNNMAMKINELGYTSSNSKVIVSNQLTIGNIGLGSPNFAIFDCHALRFYSRALAADEIAHNYAVDKARFNLPDAT